MGWSNPSHSEEEQPMRRDQAKRSGADRFKKIYNRPRTGTKLENLFLQDVKRGKGFEESGVDLDRNKREEGKRTNARRAQGSSQIN